MLSFLLALIVISGIIFFLSGCIFIIGLILSLAKKIIKICLDIAIFSGIGWVVFIILLGVIT